MIWWPYALILRPTRFPHETFPTDALGFVAKIDDPLVWVLGRAAMERLVKEELESLNEGLRAAS